MGKRAAANNFETFCGVYLNTMALAVLNGVVTSIYIFFFRNFKAHS
jgi:hypothetical protein